jgi:hypothetical protein
VAEGIQTGNYVVVRFMGDDEHTLRLPTPDVRTDVGGLWYRRGEQAPWTLCPWHRVHSVERAP